jgi:hypothetical protein
MEEQEPLKMEKWREQAEVDHRKDLQDLEGLVLKAVGGIEGLQAQLATQETIINGQAVKLEQVADWLQRLNASNGIITGHLQRMHEKVDVIKEGVGELKVGQDDLAAKLDEMFKCALFSSETAKCGPSGT